MEIDRDDVDVDELGFPRKRLTETQREYVDKLYKRERGLSGGVTTIIKSVIFDKVLSNDPFSLKKDYDLGIYDEPDNKWWHRWNSWLEEKRKEKEERKKKAIEEVKYY